MSKIEGGVPVTGFISPTDSEDTYATHKDIYGQGGYRSVANIAERDAIPLDRRSEGMLVFVKDTNLTYQLIDGTDNAHWVTRNNVGVDELTENYIIVGNELNEPQPSAALIDVHEDIAIIYERLDEIQGVGTGGGTQDRGTRDLSGFVIGDVEPDGSMYTVRGPDCLLNTIPAGDDVDLSLNKIINVGDPHPNDGTPAGDLGQYDATNRRYVDEHKWIAESITDLDSTIKGYSLDQFNPPAVNLNFNGTVLGNVATSTNPNDAATVEYVNNAVVEGDTITLTGAVTGSGIGTIGTKLTDITVSQISNFDTAVRGYRLSDFAAPTKSVSMGGYEITSVAAPTAGSSATNKDYVDTTANTAVSNRTTTLTGAVTGSGTGATINTTLTPSAVTGFRLDQFAPPTASVSMGSQRVTFVATPIQGADASNKDYVDTTTNTAVSNRTTTLTGAVTGSAIGNNAINTTLTPIKVSQITNFDTSVRNYSLSDFLAPTGALSMGNRRITSLLSPTEADNAANKDYVDGKTWTTSQIINFNTAVTSFRLNQFAVPSGLIDMNGFRIISLLAPTQGTDAANKDYVDNLTSNKPYGCLRTVDNALNQSIPATTPTAISVNTQLSLSSRLFTQPMNGTLRCASTNTFVYAIRATLEITSSVATVLTFQFIKNSNLALAPAFSLTVGATATTRYLVPIEAEAVSLANTDIIKIQITSTNATSITVINQLFQAILI